MRKILIFSILFFGCGICFAQLQIPDTENYILNQDSQQVLNTQGINDPIRDGAYKVVNSDVNNTSGTGELLGIVGTNAPISDHLTAQNQTINMIKSIVNYVLSFLALVALIYLIYHGFLILTAAGDDAQYKKGIQSLKYAVIALAGIGASWLIVSMIFRLLTLIIGP